MENTVQVYAPNHEGDYTIQNISVSEVYNRLRDKEAANPLSRAKDPGPEYGLLSQCLIPSPVIQSIFPASIRCGTDEKDVIFIGERHIELRRLTDRLNLEPVVAKSDFFCKIRSAGILTLKRGSNNSLADQIIKQEEEEVPFASSSRTPLPVKGDDSRVPSQVLTLALESGDLAFVYANVLANGKLDFKISTHRVSPEQPKVGHIGKSIAIDVNSRAMAICAWESSFRIYEIHDASSLENKVSASQPFIPLKSDKTFQVNGIIIHLEFLRSNDRDLVVWIVQFLNKQNQSRILLYEWDTRYPLTKSMQLGQDGLQLPGKWGIPLHIVPLTIATHFVLICEYQLYIGKAADITSGNCKWRSFPVPGKAQGELQNDKLVTAWARPHRNPSWVRQNDDFYIIKENGELFWIYVKNGNYGSGPMIETVESGNLAGNVGTAFCFYEVHTDPSGDLLIAAGEASSGGTYMITPRTPGTTPDKARGPLFIQEIFNWSPIFDSNILRFRDTDRSHFSTPRGRLYACTGFGNHGSVAEIRHGIECRPNAEIEFEEGVTKVIPLHGVIGNGCFLLICMVFGTRLWYIPYETLEPTEIGDAVSLRIGDHVTTIAAKMMNERCFQITTDGVYSTELKESDVEVAVMVPQPRQKWECPENSMIVSGIIYNDTVIVVTREEKGHFLRNLAIQPISNQDQDGFLQPRGDPINIASQPTFMDILRIGQNDVLLLETTNTEIEMVELTKTRALNRRAVFSTMKDFDAKGESTNPNKEAPVCESACVLVSEGITYIMCGLRNGYVVYGEIVDTETLIFNAFKRVRVGRLPVLLSPREEGANSVLAQSTYQLHHIIIENGDLVVSPIVFAQSLEPSVAAFCHLQHDFGASSFPDPIIVATESSIMLATLSKSPTICARQLSLKETPSKLLYYEPEDLLIIACLRPKADNQFYANGHDRRRVPQSTLLFVEPRTGETVGPRDLRDSKYRELIFNKPDEKIHALCYWSFPGDNQVWKCILVGTSYLHTETQMKKGRIIVLSIKSTVSNGERRLEIRKRNQIGCPEPVYSLAVYSENSIIYGSERTLAKVDLIRNGTGQLKFENPITHALPSPPTQITVQGSRSLIWVSSILETLAVYQFKENPVPTIQRIYSDDQERAGRSHVQIEENFFLTTDRDEGVLGLWKPEERRATTNLTKIFEAYLPNSIATLRSGDLRPPWKPRNLHLPGVVRPDMEIVGTCIDGSIYSFTVLTKPARELLMYVQQMYLRMAYPGEKTKPLHLREAQMMKEGNMRHINGNLLLESIGENGGWIDRLAAGDDGLLQKLLEELFKDARQLVKPGMTMRMLVEDYLKELLNVVVL